MRLADEIEKAAEKAWNALRHHRNRCSLCVHKGDQVAGTFHVENCALAQVLLDNFRKLVELRDQPSRWQTVNVIARPEAHTALAS